MKIIALLPVRNEAWILPTCLASVRPVVDEIIAVDDGSTDASRQLIADAGGLVYESDVRPKCGWSEYSIRRRLLRLGRERGGTHFVCLDADEAFSAPFIESGREEIARLKPGQKLCMRWISLWKSPWQHRADGVWAEIYKDFVVCDDGTIEHEPAFIGVGRTPGPNSDVTWRRIEPERGCVLHFQAAAWMRYQLKQCWYRCSELLHAPEDVEAINAKYSITLDSSRATVEPVPTEWFEGLTIPRRLDDVSDCWQLAEMFRWFDQYGIEFLEPLQIWHIPVLRNEFIERTGRSPRPLFRKPLHVRWGRKLRRVFAGSGFQRHAASVSTKR